MPNQNVKARREIKSKAKERMEKEREICERRIDEANEESFPASDPPSWSPTAAR